MREVTKPGQGDGSHLSSSTTDRKANDSGLVSHLFGGRVLFFRMLPLWKHNHSVHYVCVSFQSGTCPHLFYTVGVTVWSAFLVSWDVSSRAGAGSV